MASWWLPENAVYTRSPPWDGVGHGQLVAVLDGAPDLVDAGEVDLRVDAAGEHVQPQRHQAHVAGALTVAEQAALDAVGAGLVAHLAAATAVPRSLCGRIRMIESRRFRLRLIHSIESA